jgi:hypothetical protein
LNTVEWAGVYYQCEFAVNTSFDAIRHIKIELISGAYKMLSDYSIQGAAMVNKSCLGNQKRWKFHITDIRDPNFTTTTNGL